jgi:hypothetical protein
MQSQIFFFLLQLVFLTELQSHLHYCSPCSSRPLSRLELGTHRCRSERRRALLVGKQQSHHLSTFHNSSRSPIPHDLSALSELQLPEIHLLELFGVGVWCCGS